MYKNMKSHPQMADGKINIVLQAKQNITFEYQTNKLTFLYKLQRILIALPNINDTITWVSSLQVMHKEIALDFRISKFQVAQKKII